MNREQRKELSVLVSRLTSAKEAFCRSISEICEIGNRLADIADDEQNKYYNMPEGLQDSEKGERMQEIADLLQDAADGLDEYSNIDLDCPPIDGAIYNIKEAIE